MCFPYLLVGGAGNCRWGILPIRERSVPPDRWKGPHGERFLFRTIPQTGQTDATEGRAALRDRAAARGDAVARSFSRGRLGRQGPSRFGSVRYHFFASRYPTLARV